MTYLVSKGGISIQTFYNKRENDQDIDPRILQLEDPVESLRSSRFREFVDSQPDPIKQHFIVKRDTKSHNSELSNDAPNEDTTTVEPMEDETTTMVFSDSSVDCSWNIKVRTQFNKTSLKVTYSQIMVL